MSRLTITTKKKLNVGLSLCKVQQDYFIHELNI